MEDKPCTLADLNSGPVSYPLITSKELSEGDFAIDYLIDGILVKGQPAILGGVQKSLKTCVLIDAGISLAAGLPFLGRFPAQKCRTLLMSGESGLATLRETGLRVAKSKGVELADLDLLWSDALPRFGDPQHLLAMERMIQAERIKVLAVDPAYLAMPASEPGNLFSQGALLGGMNDICRAHDVTMILAHHCKKSTRTNALDPPELTDLTWSGFAEWARQWVLLGRRKKFEPGSGFHEMWMVVGGSAGHSGKWALDVDETTEQPRQWLVDIRTVEELEQESEHETERKVERKKMNVVNKLLDAMRKFPEGEPLNVLREIAGCSGGKAKEAMKEILAITPACARVEKTKRNGRAVEIYVPIGGLA